MIETPNLTIPRPPDPEGLAAFIKIQRSILRWKQATLASMAGVSVSTIERVERCESVRNRSLEKIAVALGLESDAFTRPRIKLSEEDAAANFVESLSWMRDKSPVTVVPFRTHMQVRALASTHLAVLDTDLNDEVRDDLAGLREWIDLAGFMKAQDGTFMPLPEREYRARELYRDILDYVQEIERRYRAVCLVGTYIAKTDNLAFGDATVAVICLRSKDKNPAAASLRIVWADTSVSWRAAWQAFMDEGP